MSNIMRGLRLSVWVVPFILCAAQHGQAQSETSISGAPANSYITWDVSGPTSINCGGEYVYGFTSINMTYAGTHYDENATANYIEGTHQPDCPPDGPEPGAVYLWAGSVEVAFYPGPGGTGSAAVYSDGALRVPDFGVKLPPGKTLAGERGAAQLASPGNSEDGEFAAGAGWAVAARGEPRPALMEEAFHAAMTGRPTLL
jgi:hypothetical protein